MPATLSRAQKTLNVSSTSWFIVALIGQWLFVSYMFAFYGTSVVHNNPESWNDVVIVGHIPGDLFGNFMFILHIGLAAIITIGGTLQLIPQLRNRFPRFHRYNGRLFIYTAVILSLGGLYMVWARNAMLSLNGGIAISLNAVLVIWMCIQTIRKARAKDFISHREWALRAFIVVSGVWFFRVGFMAWIMINQEAKWSTPELDGPFDLVWAYANYLLPLAILEVYLIATKRNKKTVKFMTASLLFSCTLLTALGVVAAYLLMWQPLM